MTKCQKPKPMRDISHLSHHRPLPLTCKGERKLSVDVPLYAVNVFCYLLPMAGQNITGQESQAEYREKEGEVKGDTNSCRRSKM